MAITFIGNTLGLSKQSNQNNAGTSDAIGAFSTTDTTQKVGNYPNGTTPGSKAVVTMTGLGDKVPGIPADAGWIVFADATVLFVNSSGIPIVDFGPQSSSNGHSNSTTTLVTAICSALAP